MPDLVDEINATLRPNVSVVVPGDTVKLKFEGEQGLNQDVRVRSDGNGTFLLLGDLYVEGLTVDQLRERLTEAYESQIVAIQLTVSLVESGPRFASVVGEGTGRLNLTGAPVTLLDAIGRHNWKTAEMKCILFVRWDAESQRRMHWEVDARTRYWDEERPIYMQPYDFVYIPPKVIVRFNNWIDLYIRRNIPLPGTLYRQTTTPFEQ